MTHRIFWLLPALVAGFFMSAAQAQNCSGQPNGNTLCAGPASGGAGFPSFRAMVPADIPAGAAASSIGTLGGVLTGTLPTPGLATGTVTNSNLASMPARTLKSNCTSSSGTPQDCPVANVMSWSNAAYFGVSTSNSAATNTTNFNALASSLASGVGGNIFLPCGTYPLQSMSIPSGPGTVNIYGGGKNCTFLQQDAADLGIDFLVIGSGNLHGQQDNIISDLTFTATGQKTAGAFIFTKGIDRPIFRHLIMTNAFDGFRSDGVDRHIFEDNQIFSPAQSGYHLFDGWDCGFTPVSTATTSALATGGTSFTVASAAGISHGMNVGDASVGGNFTIGVVNTVSGTTITLATGSPQTMASGHTAVFGGDCGLTAAVWVKDDWVTGAGSDGVWIAGGIGGIVAQGLEVLNTASNAIQIDTSSSLGLSNREIFFSSKDVLIDSNNGPNLNVAANSLGRLEIDGAWFNASNNHSIIVSLQRPQVNPVETGAIVSITGTTLGQSNGSGLLYQDQGSLMLVGNNISYGFGSAGAGLNSGVTIDTNTGVGTVLISGNNIRNNAGFGVRVLGTQPPTINITNNILTGNAAGSVSAVTPGTTAVCTGNIGANSIATGC